jgi:hypothetical protein
MFGRGGTEHRRDALVVTAGVWLRWRCIARSYDDSNELIHAEVVQCSVDRRFTLVRDDHNRNGSRT